ncbi:MULTISPECIES: shikimate kinase [Clostridium]|uniref:shikimate kinase n=1 Tax=Clostridium TaxID=1485 RepID=UPI000825631C|nr:MULTISPECIES: shikimate kinase [Clostridium]PJI07439.1 shikimate kinase [Clostridium sp. CT7]
MNLVLIGMPGCGKTTIGKLLSKELNMKFYDADDYLEIKNNMRISEMFNIGEDFFRDLESKALEELSYMQNSVISTGGGAVTRERNMIALRKTGKIVFINRPVDKIIEDVDTSNRPLLKEGKDKLFKLYRDRHELYKKNCDFEVLNELIIEETVGNIKCYFERKC